MAPVNTKILTAHAANMSCLAIKTKYKGEKCSLQVPGFLLLLQILIEENVNVRKPTL